MGSSSNLYVSEDIATSSTVLELPWRAVSIEIINDSATAELGYKFSSGETFATLKPLEVVNPMIRSKYVYLNGSGAYRVRATG